MCVRTQCGGACIGLLWKVVSPWGAGSIKEETYWKAACNPHSVGMCMMVARVKQCRTEWGALPPSSASSGAHPLRVIADSKGTGVTARMGGLIAQATNTMKSEASVDKQKELDAGLELCNVLQDNSPGDKSEIQDKSNIHTIVSKASFKVKRSEDYGNLMCDGDMLCKPEDKSCAAMDIAEGCKYVHAKMNAFEEGVEKKVAKNATTTCKWKNIQSNQAILDRCMEVFNCEGISKKKGGTTPRTTFKLTPENFAKLAAKHVASVDVMKTETQDLLSVVEASENLLKELNTVNTENKRRDEWVESRVTQCSNKWKQSPRDVWTSPLWSGVCTNWDDEHFKGTALVNKVLPFTKSEHWIKLQEDARNPTQFAPISNEDFFVKKAQGSSARFQQWSPIGHGVNRGVLLAKMLGVRAGNQRRCACKCCSTRMSPQCSPASSKSIQGKEKLGVGWVGVKNKAACTNEVCALAYPLLCPETALGGLVEAEYTEKLVKEDGGSLTCMDSAKAVQTMMEDSAAFLEGFNEELRADHKAMVTSVTNCRTQIFARAQIFSLSTIPGWRNALHGYIKVRLFERCTCFACRMFARCAIQIRP